MMRIRVAVFSVLVLVPFLALEARLFYMQILNAETFSSKSDFTRTWVEVVPTPRGRIVDRNGVVLAAEERCFDLEFVAGDFEKPRLKGKDPALDYDKIARMLADVLKIRKIEGSFDVAQCSKMLRDRVYPVKPVTAIDPGTGKTETWTVPDSASLQGLLGVAGSDQRRVCSDLYVSAVRALRQVDRIVLKRCSDPAKPVGVRDRRLIIQQEWRQPYPLCSGLDYNQTAEVALDEARFPGVEIRQRTRRVYPLGASGSHQIGYTQLPGRDSAYLRHEAEGRFRGEVGAVKDGADEEELRARGWFREEMRGKLDLDEYEQLENRDAFSRDARGVSGIEAYYDDALSGRPGIERREKNLLTKREVVTDRVEPIPGQDIRLTLDMALQKKAEDLLDALPLGLMGSVVVLDAQTGEILAMASAPRYDLNWFMQPRSEDVTQFLADATLKPQFNRAVGGSYPLGSIFKAVTGAAGLEAGTTTAEDLVTCNGRFDPVKYPKKFACWIAHAGGAHGPLNMRDAMARSCNCFFFDTGNKVGIERIDEMAALFGLGRKTGIDLYTDPAGQVPGPAWRRANGSGRWGFSDTLNVSIGQGQLLVSPLQAARLMAGFATGKLPVPHLRLDSSPEAEPLPLKPSTLETIRAGLRAVTMETFGTAHASGLHLFKAVGKTSTAQSSSRELGLEHHAWFAGYAPYDAPKYAFCVMVEHGGAGSKVSAETAARLLHAIWPEVDLPGDPTSPILPTSHDDPGPIQGPDDLTSDDVLPGEEVSPPDPAVETPR